jgi:hypothetical protein
MQCINCDEKEMCGMYGGILGGCMKDQIDEHPEQCFNLTKELMQQLKSAEELIDSIKNTNKEINELVIDYWNSRSKRLK